VLCQRAFALCFLVCSFGVLRRSFFIAALAFQHKPEYSGRRFGELPLAGSALALIHTCKVRVLRRSAVVAAVSSRGSRSTPVGVLVIKSCSFYRGARPHLPGWSTPVGFSVVETRSFSCRASSVALHCNTLAQPGAATDALQLRSLRSLRFQARLSLALGWCAQFEYSRGRSTVEFRRTFE
jgi:hypothetical protein